jgi:hypothetical protein
MRRYDIYIEAWGRSLGVPNGTVIRGNPLSPRKSLSCDFISVSIAFNSFTSQFAQMKRPFRKCALGLAAHTTKFAESSATYLFG